MLAANGGSRGLSGSGSVTTMLRMSLIEHSQFGAPGRFDDTTDSGNG